MLTIDWDLESPCLHRYFHPFLKDKELRSSEGILDLIRRYADTTLQPGASAERLSDMAQVQEYAASLAWDFPEGGCIDFVPAGRQDDAYAPKVSTFDWDSFWTRLRGGTVYPVPTRIEDGDKVKLNRGCNYTRRCFLSHIELLGEDPDSYWDAIEVPYIPNYAYDEILATFGDRPG